MRSGKNAQEGNQRVDEIEIVTIDDGVLNSDPNGLVSDTDLETILKDAESYKVLLSSNEGFDKELVKLLSVAKEYLYTIKRQKDKLGEKWYKDEVKLLFNKLVSKIGVLSNHFERDNFSVRSNERSILGDLEVEVDLGRNCTLVPGCLPNLKKLIELKIVDINKVNINLGTSVNLQENISFAKTEGNAGDLKVGKFEETDRLDEIKIIAGSECSFPHGASFYPGKRNDIVIVCGEKVFLGINTLVGSGTEIGDNTSIWWSSQLGNDVTIGKNVIVGQSSTIEDGIFIENDCFVPNFSKIRNGYNQISYDEYIKNREKYEGNRNIVIELSKKIPRKNQLDEINSHYNFIDAFNGHHVVPDNKGFGGIEAIYNQLSMMIGADDEKNVNGFKPFESYSYNLNLDKLKEELRKYNISTDIINLLSFGNDNKSRLSSKLFPKNKEEFLLEGIIVILEKISKSVSSGKMKSDIDSILSSILSYLEKPAINIDNKENQFFGDCYITGNFNHDECSIFVNVKSRGDELDPGDKIVVKNSAFIGGVIHGGGNKIIEDSKLFDTTAHGGVHYTNSKIGETGIRSVLNSSVVENSTIKGGAVINGSKVTNNSILGQRVSIAGLPGTGLVTIENSEIGDGVCIEEGVKITRSIIPAGALIEKGTEIIDGEVIKGKIHYKKLEKRNTI